MPYEIYKIVKKMSAVLLTRVTPSVNVTNMSRAQGIPALRSFGK